jgi:hypothetical protein
MLRDVYGEHSSHVVPIFSDEPRARAATEPAHRHPSGMPTAELQASDAAIGPPEASVIALGAPRATRPSSPQPVVEPLPAAEPVRRPETSRRLGGVVVGVGIVVAVVALSVARWVMPVLAAPQTAATSPAPTSVRVAVESSPSGAEIVDPNGRVIGTTPAVLSLPRAERPWRLLARKPGHDRIAFAARGDGDSFASLTLPTASRAR